MDATISQEEFDNRQDQAVYLHVFCNEPVKFDYKKARVSVLVNDETNLRHIDDIQSALQRLEKARKVRWISGIGWVLNLLTENYFIEIRANTDLETKAEVFIR